MKRVHILGRKNSGKTTLVTELVSYLSKQGYQVGTIKHTHHNHELDAPGKDSHRHREAGADVVGILSPGMSAVFERTDAQSKRDAARYDSLAPMFRNCALVIVEGDVQADAPRVEVWREGTPEPPISESDSTIAALISDTPFTSESLAASIPIWSRSDLARIANGLLQLAGVVDFEQTGNPRRVD